MTSLPNRIVLHLGAHKTASTHLQHSLVEAALPGVALFGPRKLRKAGETIPERFGFPLDAAKADGVDIDVAGVLARMAQGAGRLVLSDENFAGKLQTGWGRVPMPLYKTAPRRVAALAGRIAAVGGPALDLCLAIRTPAAFLESVYSQVLHGQQIIKPDAFLAKNDPADIDWAEYVARLRAVPGVGALMVWRFEDYAPLFAEICATLVGSTAVAPLAVRSQPRLSQAAVDALVQARALGLRVTASDAAREHPVSADKPPLTLYDAQVKAAADADYAAQCARIGAMAGVTLLRPGDA